MSDTELRECLWCGLTSNADNGPGLNYNHRDERGVVWFVACCVVQTLDYETVDQARDAWNRRGTKEE